MFLTKLPNDSNFCAHYDLAIILSYNLFAAMFIKTFATSRSGPMSRPLRTSSPVTFLG